MKLKDIIEYAIIIIVVILIRTFVVTPIRVNGDSMYDNLENGDLMILKKFDTSYDRFDIVVAYKGNERLIKRVIGLPGEDVKYEDGKLYINDEFIDEDYGFGTTDNFKDYCGENEYFLMGDNREVSYDSRRFGCIDVKDIKGTTDFIFFPFSKFGSVK